MTHLYLRIVAPLVLCALASNAAAQDAALDGSTPETPTDVNPPATTVIDGVLPVPDYTGDFASRRYMLGDLGGERTKLANSGIQFEVNWTQIAQGVVQNGRDTGWEYGGSLDYQLTADLQRMGVFPGAVIKFRAESRYGDTVNFNSGSIMAVNTDQLFPLTSPADEDVGITITELNLTQFFSENFAVYLGRMQTLDGDPNEFSSGRGRDQFLNSQFIFNPVTALTVPYATLGGGVLWLPTPNITLTTGIMATSDSSTTTGFDTLDEGLTWSSELQLQHRLVNKPGGINAGFIYGFDSDFIRLNRLVFSDEGSLVLDTQDDTWCAYLSGWQYLFVEDDAPQRINPGDGRPDVQGFGAFARFGFADEDTNPIEWSASIGLGGRGILPGRDDDTFGVGYAFGELQDKEVFDILGLSDSSHAIEIFYNIAVTSSFNVTLDAQYTEPGIEAVDDTIILGIRANVRF